jgi:hypothetical protein
MSKIYPIRRSFKAGEISRKFLLQGDEKAFQEGLLECTNCIITKEGTIRKRPGFRFVAAYSESTATAPVAETGPRTLTCFQGFEARVVNDSMHHVLIHNAIFASDGTSSYNAASNVWDQEYVPFIEPGLNTIDGIVGYVLQPFAGGTKAGIGTITYTYGVGTFTREGFDTASSGLSGSEDYVAGTYYQNRLCLLVKGEGTKVKKTKLLMSQTYDVDNFQLGTALDNEGLELELEKGKAAWLASAKKSLAVGTVSDEVSLESSPWIVTPTNPPELEEQNNLGGADLPTLKSGKRAIFFGPQLYLDQATPTQKVLGYATNVYAFEFDWRKESFEPAEISYYASHLADEGVLSPCITRNDFPIIWMNRITDDGTFLSCTYDTLNGVVGWGRHQTGAGSDDKIMALASSKAPAQYALWAAVDRLGESGGVYDPYIEIIDPAEDEVYLDSYLKFTGSGLTSFTAAHLANRTVSVVIDGIVHPDVDLDGSGNSGTLEFAGDVIYAGLGYTAKVETTPLDQGDPMNSARGFEKGYNKIYVGLYESAVPLINGQQPKVRVPQDNTGEQVPLVTDIVDVTNIGFSKEGTITIEQSLPVAMEVTGIFADGGQANL